MDRTDEQIREEILVEIQKEPEINAPTTIGITVNDGIVTLSGEVGSYLQKIKAESAAKYVYGVKGIVQNNIDVKYFYARQATHSIYRKGRI